MQKIAACVAAAFVLVGDLPPAASFAAEVAAPASPGKAALAIPFEPARGLILIEIEIDGERVPAVYDSGAAATVLNSAFPRRAVFAHKGKGTIRGFGGVREANIVRDVPIVVGGRRLHWKALLESDFSEVEAAFERPFAAIIGVDAFGEDIITIDVAARQLRFTPRKRFAPPAGVAKLRFARGDHPSTDIEIAGIAQSAVVDTGSSSALHLSARMAQALGIDASGGWGGLTSGAGGLHLERKGLLPSVRFAGVELHNVPVEVALSDASPADIGIGAEILSRFRLHLDYAGERMWAEPYADAATRPFDLPYLGAATRRLQPDRLSVVFISEFSPADEAGLAPGDDILAVDGRPISELPADFSPAELREPGPITFALADGRTITVQRRALDVVFQPATAD